MNYNYNIEIALILNTVTYKINAMKCILQCVHVSEQKPITLTYLKLAIHKPNINKI